MLAALLRHNFYIGGKHYVVSEKQLSIFHAYGQPWRCARNQSAHMVVLVQHPHCDWHHPATASNLQEPSTSWSENTLFPLVTGVGLTSNMADMFDLFGTVSDIGTLTCVWNQLMTGHSLPQLEFFLVSPGQSAKTPWFLLSALAWNLTHQPCEHNHNATEYFRGHSNNVSCLQLGDC